MQDKAERQKSESSQQIEVSSFSQSSRFNSIKQGLIVDELSNGEDKSKKVVVRVIQDKLLDNKYTDIIEILSQNKDIDIVDINDRKGLTLIHRMTFHMKQKEVQFMVKYALKYLENNPQKKQLIQNWINIQNEEGFTALHYASFKGDIDTISYLISLGANYMLKNKNGLNVLHIAAQGDQPISLCFFESIGLDLNMTDQKGGTSLHWASYLGSENAVNFLVSKMKDQINSVDGEGLTPLHLAVISGNARVVKKLLQRGADRNKIDFNKKTPAQLAEENEYHNIQQMLEKTGGFAEYCNIKQPFKPMKKNLRQLLVLVLLLLLAEGSIISFIIPCFDYHMIELSIWAFFILGTLISLILAWRTNPGEVNGIRGEQKEYDQLKQKQSLVQNNEQDEQPQLHIQKNEYISRSNVNNSIIADDLGQHLLSNDYQDNTLINVPQIKAEKQQMALQSELIILYQNNEVSHICVECCIVKPKRSRHCEICKKCIRVYDHHCPWINNCVGAQNYKYFIMFILFMWFNMLTAILLIFFHITSTYDSSEGHDSWILNWYSDLSSSTLDTLVIIKYVVSGLVIALTFFFFVLHTILCFVQMSNLFLNQTTFERYNVHQVQQPNENESSQQPHKSSQSRSSQSSTADVNPSIIQSNSRTPNNLNRNKLGQGAKNFSLQNAYLMCCKNSNDLSYDYAPPVKNGNQQQNINQNITRQMDTAVSGNQNNLVD